MAGTIFGVPDDRRSVDLDPWHRMQFGLTGPQVIDFATQGSGTVNIPSVASNREYSAVLFWNSRKGKQEYFLVELREPTPGTVYCDVSNGFAIWAVQVDANGNPESPGAGIPGVAAIGKTTGLGGSDLWQGGDRTPLLTRIGDASPILSLEFARPNRGVGTISWSTPIIFVPPRKRPREPRVRIPVVRRPDV
jgi:hypothetical protein